MSPGLHQLPPAQARALLRVQASRLRLRHALGMDDEGQADPEVGVAGSSAAVSWLRRWTVGARRWWRAQPWRHNAEMVAGAVEADIGPLIRRHPLASVALAAAGGALIVALKPWRFTPVAALMAPWLLQLRGWAGRQLVSAPVQQALEEWLQQALRRQQPGEQGHTPSQQQPARPAATAASAAT